MKKFPAEKTNGPRRTEKADSALFRTFLACGCACLALLMACGIALSAEGPIVLATPLPEKEDKSSMEEKTSAHAVRAIWMGTAGMYITDGETGFYIDPYVSRAGMARVFFSRPLYIKEELIDEWIRKTGGVRASAVIVSHSHFDHVLDAPYFARKTGALFIGSGSTAWVGRGAGLPEGRIRTVRGGDAIQLGAFTLHFIESKHGPALFGRIPYPGEITGPLASPVPARKYRLGTVFSILIEHPSGRLLHHGSAGYLPDMFKGVRADCMLLGIGGRGDTASYLENAVLPTGIKTLIPIHCDNFFKPLDVPFTPLINVNMEEFEKTASRYGDHFKVRTIPLGKEVTLLP